MLKKSLALILALLHMSAGFILLLFSAWFIAACALAGVGFNYMLPAVVIRGLALIRIASGYGQMWLGHQQLLENLGEIRLALFQRCFDGWINNQDEGNEALTRHTEAIANLWIAWVSQSAGAIVMLAIAQVVVFWLLPELVLYTGLLLLTYVMITLWLVISGLLQANKIVQTQQRFTQQSVEQLSSVSLWSMQRTLSLVDGSSLWQVQQKRQCRTDLGINLLHAISLGLLILLLNQDTSSYLGEATLLILMMLLLNARDWLSPSISSHPALTEYLQASKQLQNLQINHVTRQTLPESINRLQLSNFKASGLPVPSIDLTLQGKGVVVLKGSSGTGKSSLLKAICGLLDHEGVRSVNSSETAPGHITNWHYSDQFPVCLSATLSDNLRIAKQNASQQELKQALTLADLEHLKNHLQQWLGQCGRTLSGGELKRLNLARALLCDTQLLLLDEPFEGLAFTQQNKMAKTINWLAKDGPVVIATHIVPEELEVSQVVELEEAP